MKHKSRIFESVHETAKDLHDLGFIDKRTMQSYDALCIEPVPDYNPEQIRKLRSRYRLSQAVFASMLNTSLSTVQKWEIGEKHPSGHLSNCSASLIEKGLRP